MRRIVKLIRYNNNYNYKNNRYNNKIKKIINN